MINELPCDIFLYISDNFLHKNNQRLLNTCGLYSENEKQNKNSLIKKSAYKITLFTLIIKNQNYLFREIDEKLKSYIFGLKNTKI